MEDHWGYLYLQSVKCPAFPLQLKRSERVSSFNTLPLMRPVCCSQDRSLASGVFYGLGFNIRAKPERVARDAPVTASYISCFTCVDLCAVVIA